MDLNWFHFGPLPSNEIKGIYNHSLVALSYVIAVLASYVALDLAARIRAESIPKIQMYWLLGGAFAMGAGIWSMHFIGMLAFIMPMPMGYEFAWTFSSLLIAILASGLALYLLKNKDRPLLYMVIGGVFMGLGIATMHYMGMMGMTSHVTIRYLPGLFFLSIAIAIVASEAALWLALRTSEGSLKQQFYLKILSALIMGAAICGMHYTGMFAAVFTPLPISSYMSSHGIINPNLLALGVGGVTAIIIGLALIISIYSRQMTTAIQNEKDFLNVMLNNLSDGILACDARGRITVCNYSFCKYVTINKDTSYLDLNQYFELRLPKNTNALAAEETPLSLALKGQHISSKEYLLILKGDKKRHVIVDGQPIININGEKIGAVVVFHDVTDLKQTENLKQEFISIVSHELRTPLTSIRGSLSLVLGQAAGAVPEKMFSLLEIANNNTERLIRLINDILDVEKIEAGKMDFNFKDLDIAALIKEAIANVQAIAEKAQVKLVFEYLGKEIVHGDYDKLMQVMVNLLSNAIRFSEEGQVVTVKLLPLDNTTRVSVIDHGPGISEEFRSKIFTKFSQADSTSARKKGGSGLGLSISKGIIEKHGGQMSFESIPNQITSFYFDLSKNLVENKAVKKPYITQKKVPLLICDSNPDSAAMLQKFLLANKIESEIALTAEHAKELLKQKSYEVIAMDLVLQDYDGIKFIQELRQQTNTAITPIIVISTQIGEGRKILNGAGFPIIDWLEKPLKENQLNQLLEHLKVKFGLDSSELPHVLCVEDDPDIYKIVKELLNKKAKVSTALTVESARKKLATESYDLIILDLRLPDGMGTDLLPCTNCKTKEIIPVVVFSAYELEPKYAHLVKKALLKSRVSNEELLAVLRSVLGKTD